ncbi:hypothetical protein [Thalassolituus sp.]|uniref:hypothetical protein n=1 Tax=Thalassolituus sp. TaxID=2030822 RepID=UPI002637FB87|nr:hypothetical protein [uncultured Thalassolituus sp.]
MSDATAQTQDVSQLQSEVDRLEEEIQRITNKLQNDGFIARVPAAMIEKEQIKLAKYEQQQKALKAQISEAN